MSSGPDHALDNCALKTFYMLTILSFFDQWVEPMADAGADQYTFHIEATDKPAETIKKIKDAGMKVNSKLMCYLMIWI